jgi:ComEC/Rec2-related protein
LSCSNTQIVKKTLLIKTIVGLILIGSLGFWRMHVLLINTKPSTIPFRGVVNEPSLVKDNRQILSIRDDTTGQIIQATALLFPSFTYGDWVEISEGKITNNQIMLPKIEVLEHGHTQLFLKIVYQVKAGLINQTNKILREPYAALVLGIVLGIPQDLGKNLSDQLRQVGITHIIVASGYNVSLILGQSERISKFLGKRRGLTLLTLILGIYIFITGLQPPIMRASLMGVGIVIATILGRQKSSYLWLIYSTAFILIFKPELYSSISLQLSFFSTMGIILFQSRIKKFLILFPQIIREDMATTMAVFLLTAPVMLWHFGNIQPISLIVNILALFVLPTIVWLSITSLGISLVSTTAAQWCIFPVELMLRYMGQIFNIFSF